MAGEMFGAPAGLIAGTQQNDARMLNAFKGAQAFGEIQLQPYKMAELAAQTQEHTANARLKEDELRTNALLAASMRSAGQGEGPPPDPADMMQQLGTTALQSGAIKQGSKLLLDATSIRQKGASEARAAAQAQLAQLRAVHLEAQQLGAVMANVTDQQTYNQARMLAASQGSDVSALPEIYNPQLVSHLRSAAMSVAEQNRIQIQELEAARHQADSEDLRKTREATRELTRARTSYTERREATLGKAGGGVGVIGEPAEAAVKAAKSLIKNEFPDLPDSELAARDIAARARILVRQNPALDIAQARYQAFNEAKLAGDFQVSGGVDVPLVGKVGGDNRYVGGGKTSATALPIPMNGKKIDVAKTIDKRFYSTDDGKIWQRQGRKMLEVTQ